MQARVCGDSTVSIARLTIGSSSPNSSMPDEASRKLLRRCAISTASRTEGGPRRAKSADYLRLLPAALLTGITLVTQRM